MGQRRDAAPPPARNRLAQARTAAGLSQTRLGALVGVSRETISNIERGLNEPSLSLALWLARVLDARVEDLFWLDVGYEYEIRDQTRTRTVTKTAERPG